MLIFALNQWVTNSSLWYLGPVVIDQTTLQLAGIARLNCYSL